MSHIFFDPTLNYLRCIPEELPKKPDINGFWNQIHYDHALMTYDNRIAELKRNALRVVNPEIIDEYTSAVGLPYAKDNPEFNEWPGEIDKKRMLYGIHFQKGLGHYELEMINEMLEVNENKFIVVLILPNSQSKEDDCNYGSLGVLSKEEAELEAVYDKIIKVGTLEGIGILREFKNKNYGNR